jgi:hypothetical protein
MRLWLESRWRISSLGVVLEFSENMQPGAMYITRIMNGHSQ